MEAKNDADWSMHDMKISPCYARSCAADMKIMRRHAVHSKPSTSPPQASKSNDGKTSVSAAD